MVTCELQLYICAERHRQKVDVAHRWPRSCVQLCQVSEQQRRCTLMCVGGRWGTVATPQTSLSIRDLTTIQNMMGLKMRKKGAARAGQVWTAEFHNTDLSRYKERVYLLETSVTVTDCGSVIYAYIGFTPCWSWAFPSLLQLRNAVLRGFCTQYQWYQPGLCMLSYRKGNKWYRTANVGLLYKSPLSVCWDVEFIWPISIRVVL